MNPPSSSSLTGKQPSLRRSLSSPPLCSAAEFCGGTTAGCAALCCCAPCSVLSLVVFAVFKVPRRICRRTIRRMRRRRRRRIAKKEVLENGDCEKKLSKVGSSQFAIHPLESKDDGELDKLATYVSEEEDDDDEVIALEKEMWNKFNSGGFWRS